MSSTHTPTLGPATTLRPTPPPPPNHWTPGRVVTLVLGILMLFGAAWMLAAAGTVHLVDKEWRDGGYLTTDETPLATSGYALTVEEIDLDGLDGDWLLGRARIRVTASDPGQELFVGVAPSDEVAAYLNGVKHSDVTEIDDPSTRYADHAGGAPSVDPEAIDTWTSRASGSGTQSIDWMAREGHWSVVVMNADGSPGVHVRADVGATVPLLDQAKDWALGVGILSALTGTLLIVVAARGARRSSATR